MPEQSAPSISRDQLEKLVGAPKVTIYGWWEKGHLAPPSNPGGRANAATFTVDEAWEVLVFSRIVRGLKRRLQEGAVAARYIHARPGTFEVLRRSWTADQSMTVYPQYDLAAFNGPPELELRLTGAFEDRLTSLHGPQVPKALVNLWRELRDVSKPVSIPGAATSDLGYWVDRIFGSYKGLQRGRKGDFTYTAYPEPGDAPGIPWDGPLLERLLAESWAMEHIDRGIEVSGWTHTFPRPVLDHFSINLASAVESLAGALG